MSATGTSAGERLVDIITNMVHGGVNARRTLSRGLIITYMAPEPDVSREQARWSLTAARLNHWPDDEELKIVLGCLHAAWRTIPGQLVYDASEWRKEQRGSVKGTQGTFTVYWRQWPVREVFSAPARLQETLRAALARR